MNVALITGSYPPAVCGVGDYTWRLARALRSLGIAVTVVTRERWSLSQGINIVGQLGRERPDIVHIQYPTVGYGFSLSPQLISLLKPGIVTLHEASQAHVLRRLFLYPFFVRTRHIIFTTDFERSYAIQWAPWIAKLSSVIPIGNNFAVGPGPLTTQRTRIIYFGLIRPNKGIEDVISFASLIRQRSLAQRICIIGKVRPDHRAYVEKLQQDSAFLPIDWHVNVSDERVAELLAEARIAYLPFPDGASERRGSLLTMLDYGIAVMTTKGLQTSPKLERAVIFVRNPEHALETMQHLCTHWELIDRLADEGRAYAALFSWDAIARQHLRCYEHCLSMK